MMKDYDLAILVVAAGRGSRAGEGLPKQYRPLAGRPLLAHTLSALLDVASDARILTVIHPDDHDLYDACTASLDKTQAERLVPPVHGGATRQDSVRAGLEALAAGKAPPHIVLIQDGARPFPNESLIARARAAALDHGAAVPALLVIDTIKEVNEAGKIVATPARAALRAVQTPQAFRFDLILAAHRKAADAGENGLTDDAAIAEWAGHAVHVFEGEIDNMKVTSADDLAVAERRFLKDLPDVIMPSSAIPMSMFWRMPLPMLCWVRSATAISAATFLHRTRSGKARPPKSFSPPRPKRCGPAAA
jgi:2-C-methyl-D-erythritol 4-phosphate cytidylyltransferase / 2-C-methyl-D-erythritol 2,4-cyclodiphosphate synthase